MRAENLIWIGKPSKGPVGKYKEYPRYTVWPFKAKFDGKKCGTTFYMGVKEHEIYLAEKELLEKLTEWGIYEGNPLRPEIVNLIEEYGNKREEKGRHDVKEDWAEANAGESI